MSYQCQCYGFNASIARLQVVCDLLIGGRGGNVFENRLPFCKYIPMVFNWNFICFFFSTKNISKSRGWCYFFWNWMRAIHALNHYYYFMIHNWMACYQIYSTHFHLKLNFDEFFVFVYSITIYLPFFRESTHIIKQFYGNIHSLGSFDICRRVRNGWNMTIFPSFDANIYTSTHTCT